MSKLKHLHDEVKYRKQEAYGILKYKYNDDQIRRLCQIFDSTSPDALGEDFDDEITFYGVAALVSFMSLERKLPLPDKGFVIEDESIADIVLDAMNATMCLVSVGWTPSGSFAETRLKQLRNQPKTRQRKNYAYDDFFEKIENYKDDNGYPPKHFHIFLSYLERTPQYRIDMGIGKGIIDHPSWDKPRSVETVKNWYREIMKNLK